MAVEPTLQQAKQLFHVQWQSPDVAHEAINQEPERFRALAQAVAQAVQALEAAPGPLEPGAWHKAVGPYIQIINNFLETKQAWPASDLVLLIKALLQVVLCTPHDLEVQIRVAECLSKILFRHKRVLSRPMSNEAAASSGQAVGTPDEDGAVYQPPALVLPWRPLFDLVVSLNANAPHLFQGVGLLQNRQTTLTTLVTRCRRYFEPDVVLELWSMLQPSIMGVTHSPAAANEALGWFCLFAPTNQINRIGPQRMNQLLGDWMTSWSRLSATPSWDTMWMGLMGRTAKHDWKGHLDWLPYLDVLFTRLVAVFDVPVGAVTNAPAIQRPAGGSMAMIVLFSSLLANLTQHSARLVVHLLRSAPCRPATVDRAAAVRKHLKQLVALLDNYAHPSNTGRWSKDLSSWLNTLTEEFMHQLGKQGASSPPWYSVIDPANQDAFVDITLSLAARAQFSKDEGLSRTAATTLGQLAYVRPHKVLPLVVSRFRAALENDTATHQLSATITCLARCVRPMLLSGWGLEEETGPQLLAEALVALLPGLDANDEVKTLAVIHLYVAVLSTAPGIGTGDELAPDLPEAAVRIPVYVDDWADDVVTRLTSLLINMDTGLGHRADAAMHKPHAGSGNGSTGGSSFLHGHHSLYLNLIELLLSQLPADASKHVARRLAQFGASEVLPGVEHAVVSMVAGAAFHHPDIALQELVHPLLSKLTQELAAPDAGAEGKLHEISPIQETTACYQMGLLFIVLRSLPAVQVMPLVPQVLKVADAALATTSLHTQQLGGALLRAVSHCCVDHQFRTPSLCKRSLAPLGPDGALLMEWVDREATGIEPFQWAPPPAEGAAIAEQLLSQYVIQAADKLGPLVGVAGAGGTPTTTTTTSTPNVRLHLHSLLVQIKSVVLGLGNHLPDFSYQATSAAVSATPLHVAGSWQPQIAPAGVRERLAGQLAAVGRALYGQHDLDSLTQYLSAAKVVLCVGALTYQDTKPHRSASLLEEPAAAGGLVVANTGDPSLPRPWRKRGTLLAAAQRTYDMHMWRTSQRAFRSWCSLGTPQLTQLTQLSPEFIQLLHVAFSMTTHPLRAVRSGSAGLIAPVLTRFNFLAQFTLPQLLATLGDLPATLDLALDGTARPELPAVLLSPASTPALRNRLLAAACREVAGPPGVQLEVLAPGGAAQGGQTQGERDSQVEGAVQVLVHNLAFWRLLSRDELLHECMLYALLASRAHNSSVSQSTLNKLFMNILSRYIRPISMHHASPAAQQLAANILHLANPATLRSSFRYSLIANMLLLLLHPPTSTDACCMPFLNHYLSCIVQPRCPLQLGQLALSGLQLVLGHLVDAKQENPEAASAISSWLSSPGTGTALTGLMSLDHATLEASEGGQAEGRRGIAAGMAQLLSMTQEELLLRVIAASMDRMTRWVDHGAVDGQPEGIRGGFFVPGHAQLVHQLAVLAPGPAAAALRPALEAAAQKVADQQVITTSDKADQATAAECTAGLLAAGVPFLSTPGDAAAAGAEGSWIIDLTTRQLQGCTLEQSEGWAVVMRYGVSGLTKVAHPPPSLYSRFPTPQLLYTSPNGPAGLPLVPSPLTPLTPDLALSGLQTLLTLARTAGPLPSAHVSGTAAGTGTAGAGVGSGQVAVLKRLRYLHQCSLELISVRVDHATPSQVVSYWTATTNELRQLLHVDVFTFRQQLGKMIGVVIMHLGGSITSSGGSSGDGTDNDLEVVDKCETQSDGAPLSSHLATLRTAVSSLQQELLAAMRSGTAAVQALRHTHVPAGEAAAGGLAEVSQPQPPANNSSGSETAPGSAAASDIVMIDRPASPVALPDDWAGKTTPGTISPTGGSAKSGPQGQDREGVALSRVGVALGFLHWATFNGDLVKLQPLLIALLPNIFRLQELAGPVLQKLSHDAQFSLVLAKYWPPQPDQPSLNQVLSHLEGAAAPVNDQWSVRGAALSYAQYWWFRTCFLLGPEQAGRLQKLVQDRLADSKPEVRSMAGATLSGMLRGMDPAACEGLRSQLLQRAKQLLVSRKAPADGSKHLPNPQQLLEKHALVQGLTAFLQSSPYDCPAWMPSVLLALVPPASSHSAAGIEAAVRNAAAKALSEFKRTHEQDSMAELRSLMSEDEWDSLQQATGGASYFS